MKGNGQSSKVKKSSLSVESTASGIYGPWDVSKPDNLDCTSRIIKNIYGVDYDSDEGQEIYEWDDTKYYITVIFKYIRLRFYICHT